MSDYNLSPSHELDEGEESGEGCVKRKIKKQEEKGAA